MSALYRMFWLVFLAATLTCSVPAWGKYPGGYMGQRRPDTLRYQLWHWTLEGNNFVEYYASTGSEGVFSADFRLAYFYQWVHRDLQELKHGIGTLVAKSEFTHDGVALLHSQASVHLADLVHPVSSWQRSQDLITKLEAQYLQAAGGLNFTDEVEGLKVKLVALQRACANLELAREDREIVRELGGACSKTQEPPARDELVRAQRLIKRCLRGVAQADGLGYRYQTQGAEAIGQLAQQLGKLQEIVQSQIQRLVEHTATVTLPPAWSAPQQPPPHIGAWPTDVLWGGVYGRFGDGNDTVQCEMRKAKAAGLDWMEVGWWGYHFPVLYDLMKRDDQDIVLDLVRPIAEAGLKVEWHTHAKAWGEAAWSRTSPAQSILSYTGPTSPAKPGIFICPAGRQQRR